MKQWFVLGAALAALGVAAGAFGAHGLRAKLTADMLAVYETGARYHLIHAVGLLAIGVAAHHWPGNLVQAAGWLMVAGIALFSGSLYALAITGVRGLGAITPLGGLAFISSWVLLAIAAARS